MLEGTVSCAERELHEQTFFAAPGQFPAFGNPAYPSSGGAKHNTEWLGNFTGQFFCSFRIAFRPTNHPLDGNPRFICLLIAGSPCIGIRLAKFFSDGFTSQNTQFSPFNCNRTLYTRIGFSGPIEVSVLGGPLYR